MANRVETEKVERFVVEVIKNFDPTISLSKGEPLYDLFVRFYNLTVLVKMLELITETEQSYSYLNFELPEDKYDELLDRNFFTRAGGSSSRCTIGLVFDNKTTVFGIKRSDNFIINDNIYNASQVKIVTPLSYSVLNQNEYIVKVPVVTTTIGSSASLSIGDSVGVPYANLEGFLRAYVESEVTVGEDSESNEAAYNRLISSISTENLVNPVSISAQFSRNLRGIVRSVQVIGHTDPEMFRDTFSGEIPSRNMILYFIEPVNIQLIHKDQYGNIITRFRYDKNPNIEYHLDLPAGQTSISKTLIDKWEKNGSGLYEWKVPVKLLSLENPKGFHNDVRSEVVKAYVDPLGHYVQNIEPLLNQVPELVGCNSSLEAYSITIPEQLGGSSIGVKVQGSIHFGGFTDIYITSDISRVTRSLLVPIGSGGVVEVPTEFKPILKIHKVTNLNNVEIPVYDTLNVDVYSRYTAEDKMDLFIDPSYEGSEVLVDFSYTPNTQIVSAYINKPINRLQQDNMIVKSKTPVFVSAIIEVTLSGNSNTELLNVMKTAFFAYLSEIVEASSIPVSKLISSMDTLTDNTIVFNSFTVFATQHMPNGEVVELEVTDSIIPIENLSIGVSSRTIEFIGESVEFIINEG